MNEGQTANVDWCDRCNGDCCRDMEQGSRIRHNAAAYAAHVCDYCMNGEALDHRPTERERVVAYIRNRVKPELSLSAKTLLTLLADRIEEGAHLARVDLKED